MAAAKSQCCGAAVVEVDEAWLHECSNCQEAVREDGECDWPNRNDVDEDNVCTWCGALVADPAHCKHGKPTEETD